MIKNLKIRMRLLLSYAVIIVVTMIASMVALVMLRGVGSDLTDFYENNHVAVVSAWTARRSVYANMSNLLQGLQETTKAETQKFLDLADADLKTVNDLLEDISYLYPEAAEEIKQIRQILSDTESLRAEIYSTTLDLNNEQAYKLMKDEYVPQLDQMREILSKISDAAQTEARQMVENGERSVAVSVVIVLVIVAASVVIAIALGVYIANGICKPVAEIEAAAKHLSSGHLKDAIVTYESRDELGSLAGSMRVTVDGLNRIIVDLAYLMDEMAGGNFDILSRNRDGYVGDFEPILLSIRTMNSNLSDTLSQINESSDQVSSGSDQVAGGAQALSQGATEQASAVQQLAATISEISDQVRRNADNAKSANEQANNVSVEAGESNKRMQDMLTAMNDISSGSNEIGKIIKTIEDIAFQTNILALNAAVEAARAGAAGKGFAVVADEVRNLANKSQEASKNTATLIESSLHAVERGTKIANETAESLGVVLDGVNGAAKTIEQITLASSEQANAITQVTQGVDQISTVVQTNSATAEQSAAASEELSGQAQMLKNLVSRFRLRNSAKGSGSVAVAQKEFPETHAPATSEQGDFSFHGTGKY